MPVANVLPLSRSAHILHDTVENCRAHLRAHYHRLGQASRRMRFMAEPSARALDRIAEQATPDLMLEIEADGAVRGILEAYGTVEGHAEIALSVEDGYQGQGLGRSLFEEGLRLLAQSGYRTADLCCVRTNTAVLHLVREAGGCIRFDGDAVQAEVELGRILEHAERSPPAPDRRCPFE